MATPSSRSRIIDIIGWVLLAAAIIFAVLVRVRLREFPLERDEGEFAYAGQLLLQGVPPYKLAYNMKLPGTYIAYAVLMAVFGQTTAGVHLGLLAVNVATILLLYRLTREMFDPISAGLAAAFYAMASVSPGVLGMAAHATHFVGFFGLAGVYLLWRYLQSPRWWSLVASGFLLGTAFLMKQQGVFLMVFGGATVAVATVVGLVKASRENRPNAESRLLPILQAAAFYAAVVLPYGLVCFWLWRAGVFDKFWFWTVTYAREYVAEIPLNFAWQSFWYGEGAQAVASGWIIWTLALGGCVSLAVRARTMPGRSLFVLGYLFCAFLCVCPGFYFRVHYFIVMLPAVAMLAGVGCGDVLTLAGLWKVSPGARTTAKEQPGRRTRPHPQAAATQPTSSFAPLLIPAALLVLAAVLWPIWEQGAFFFAIPSRLACQLTYRGNPFTECPEIAEYLKAHTSPDDTIAVLGSEPEIFFDAARRSATGYIYTYGLMEVQPLALQMQQEMLNEIKEKQPKYIVFANVAFSWLPKQKSETLILREGLNYLQTNYEMIGLCDFRTPLSSSPVLPWATDCYWDSQLSQYQPRQGAERLKLLPPFPYLAVFRRKP